MLSRVPFLSFSYVFQGLLAFWGLLFSLLLLPEILFGFVIPFFKKIFPSQNFPNPLYFSILPQLSLLFFIFFMAICCLRPWRWEKLNLCIYPQQWISTLFPTKKIQNIIRDWKLHWMIPVIICQSLEIIVIVLVFSMISQGLLSLFFDVLPTSSDIQIMKQLPFAGKIILCFSAVFLAPLTEELIFRKFIFDGLKEFFKRLMKNFHFNQKKESIWFICTFITALLFSLIHFDLLKIIPLMALSFYFQWLRLHSHSLWPCIIAHATNNLFAVIVLCFIFF